MLKKNLTDLSKTVKEEVSALNKYQIFIGIISVITSFYLRIESVLNNSMHFSFDQGIDQLLVKQLVVDQKITLISRYTGLEGVFMGPFYTWLMSIPFLLSGGDPRANVIFLSVLGIISSVITFFLVKSITDNRLVGYITFLLTLLSPAFLASSKIILSPSPLTFLAVFYIYFIWKIIKEKKYSFALPLAFLTSLFFQFEIGYAIFALPAAALIILFYRNEILFKWKIVMVSLGLFLIPFVPQILFDLRHDFHITNAIIGFFKGTNESLGSSNQQLYQRVVSRLIMMIEDFINVIGFGIENKGVILISSALVVYASYLIFAKKHQFKKILQILYGLIFIFYIGFVIYKGPIWSWYRVGLPFIFLYILSLSISYLWQSFPKYKPFLVIYFGLLFLVAVDPQDRIIAFNNQPIENVSHFGNQHQALDNIYKKAQGEPFSLYIYTPPVYPWIWDYQIWWYAKRKYGYIPSPYDRMPQSNNPEKIFLLIEKPEFETDKDGWYDNFNHFGESLSSEILPSGITIEEWKFTKNPSNTNPLIKYYDVFKKNN